MLLLSVLAYPAAQLLLLVILTLLLSMCLSTKAKHGSDSNARSEDTLRQTGTANPTSESPRSTAGSMADLESSPEAPVQVQQEAVEPSTRFTDFGREVPLLPRDKLTSRSLKAYEYWFHFCRAMPCFLVVITPIVLVTFSWPYPQEVFSILRVVTSVLMLSNAMHLVLFCTSSVNMIVEAERRSAAPGGLLSGMLENGMRPDVMHWVICPQYKEEVEVTCLALSSISQSV